MCSQHEETVDHIISGCEVLAYTEYISRYNNSAAYPLLHWSICKDHDIEITDRWYNNNNITIMWDMPVNTDRTITGTDQTPLLKSQ